MKRCGFVDCNNPAERRQDSCLTCSEREENKICSACRRKEGFDDALENRIFTTQASLFSQKHYYQLLSKLRNKVPVRFQNQIDQLLPQIKLNEEEEELIKRMEKVISDHLTEKGGKEDNVFWTKFCSTCNSESVRRIEFFEQEPAAENIREKLYLKEGVKKVFEEIEQEIGEERLGEIYEEAEGEVFDKAREDNGGPTGPTRNDNSAEITQLQREVNGLKQQIRDLKNNPNPGNPSPSDSDALQRIEDELRRKEAEIRRLKTNNSPSNSSDKGNPNMPLYLSFGAIGIVVILFALFLVFSQKKKKSNSIKYNQVWE